MELRPGTALAVRRVALCVCLLALALTWAMADGAAAPEQSAQAPLASVQPIQVPTAQIQAPGAAPADRKTPAPIAMKMTPGFVTNVFADEDIRQALRDIAAQSGVVIIPDQAVQGIVSVELQNVPVEQALDMVLFGGGYVYRKVGGYYLVGSADPKSATFSALASVERVQLKQSGAKEVYEALNAVYHDYVQPDYVNNVLVVTAPDRLLRQIVEQIRTIDQPAEQVMIEVMVVEISSGKAKDLGVRWRFDSFGFDVGDPLTSTTTGSGDNSLSWTEVSATDLVNLRLLVGQNLATIRANPRISTLNGREAELFVGRQEYFSVITGNAYYPTTQLQEVNAGITLKIKPYIGENGELVIYLDPEVSDVIGTNATNGSPIVAKRSVHTVVRSQEEKTIVIGGLTQIIKQINEAKVPLLGDVPLLGQLFRSKQKSSEETEIVIFLRPHILRNGAATTWKPVRDWPEVLTPTQEAQQGAAAQTQPGGPDAEPKKQ